MFSKNLRHIQGQKLLEGDIGSFRYGHIKEASKWTKDIGKKFKSLSGVAITSISYTNGNNFVCSGVILSEMPHTKNGIN